MANVPVYNITDIPTKRAIMALESEVASLGGKLKAMTTRNGVEINQFGLDKEPTRGSDNAVASGGVYNALANVVGKQSVSLPSAYIQNGAARTAIFGTIIVSRYGQVVTLYLDKSNARPLPKFDTVATDITILAAGAIPAEMRPRSACRFFGGCTWHTSSTTAGGQWGYVMLDVETSGLVRIRGIFKLDGTRVGYSATEYLETIRVTATWMTN